MVNKALDFDVKATGKDEAQKRQEFVNMRPGATCRRYLERWQARAEEVQPLQEKQGQAWKFFRRQGGLRRRTREEFEEFDHKVMRNIKADEKLLQNGRTSCRPRPGGRTSIGSSGDEAEADGDGGLQFPTAPSMGEAAGTRIVLLVAVPKNG